jgi:hypothetical protein
MDALQRGRGYAGEVSEAPARLDFGESRRAAAELATKI